MKATTYQFRILSIITFLAAIWAPLFSLNTPALAQSEMSAEMMNGFSLKLDITGLEDLGEGWAYEGWLIIDDAPVSTGVFTVDGDGRLSTDTFAVSSNDRTNATTFVLTIEPSPDDDPAPSSVHLLGGNLADGAAELSIDHSAALGADFADATGSYIIGLGYPEGATSANDYTNGIWYPNSLDLPALPTGWVYEGWVVGEDGPISTGRFTDPDAMDQDGSGSTAGGVGTGPDFPGQDFFEPPVSLIGYAAVISVEPEPDNNGAPFTLKPLVDTEIEDVGDHNSQEMLNNSVASSPTGTVTFLTEMKLAVAAQGEFVGADATHIGQGTATIYEEGGTLILRLEDFMVTNGPDLHMLLIEDATATTTAALGDYVDLGSLKSNVGDQSYEIPANVELSQYNGVMIYCMPFHVAFATAVLVN